MFYVVNAVAILVCSVGQPKHSRVMAGGLEGEFFFGSKAEVCMRPSSLSVGGHVPHLLHTGASRATEHSLPHRAWDSDPLG